MEALLLAFDVAVLIVVFMWAIRNDGMQKTIGIFRFKDDPQATPPTARPTRFHRSPRG